MIENRNGMMATPEAAAYLGLSVHTLNRWRWDGRGPNYVKLGKSVRYRRDELDRFIEAGETSNTTQGAA